MAFGRDLTDLRFRHYCRTGDPDALGDVFDQTAGRLMRVALWLCGNRADADDLLQRTFLRVIETRRQFRPGEPVLPWLMGVLGNQARQLRSSRDRTASLRPHPDRVVDPEAEAASRELDAAVRAVRERLGEPYREVLQLHLELGLNAKEIAERLLRPAGTVRTQLMRALQLLRQKLPGGFVAGLTAFAAVDASALAAVRQAVMVAAKSALPAAVASAAVAMTATVGGLLMAKKVLLVLPALLLLSGLATWAAWPVAATAPPSTDVGLAKGRVEAPPTTTSVAKVASPTTALERLVVADAAAPDPGFANLRVLVHWQQDNKPAAGVGVRVTLKQGSQLHDRAAVTGDDGIALLPHLAPGSYYVEGSCLLDVDDVELAAGQQLTILAAAAPTSVAQGRVVDADGRAVAGAHIWQSIHANWGVGWQVAISAADGSFTVPLRGYQYLGARLEGHVPSYMRSFEAAKGPHRDLVLQLRGPAASIRGTVRDCRGAPVPWALVLAGPSGGAGVQDGEPLSHLTTPNPERLTTDAEGRFLAQEVPPVDGPLWIWAPGFGPLRERYHVTAGTTTELQLTLADAAVVFGVVRDSAGKQVAGAGIRFGDEYDTFPSAHTRADDAGRFELGDLPADDWVPELTVGKATLGTKIRLQLHAGERTEWNPVLDSGRSIAGTVLGPDGTPAAGLKVGAVHPNENRVHAWNETDRDGRFRLIHVGDQPRILRVARGDKVLREIAGIAPDRDDVVIRLEARELATAKLSGRILAATGQPAHGRVRLQREGTTLFQSTELDTSTGGFAFDDLRAVRYALAADTLEAGRLDLGTVDLQPDQDQRLDDVVLQPSGALEVTVLDTAGLPVEHGEASLWTAAGTALRGGEIQHGVASFPALQPGHYFVEAYSTAPGDSALLCGDCEVTSGATAQLQLRGRAAVQADVHLRDPAAPDRFVELHVCWRTAAGHLAGWSQTFAQNPEPMHVHRYVPPGRYRLECKGPDGLQFTADVEVEKLDGGNMAKTITVDLPRR